MIADAGLVRDRVTLQRWLSSKKKRPVDLSAWSAARVGGASVFTSPDGRRAYAVRGQCIAGADPNRRSVERAVDLVAA